ncbi:AI-2E family transporter [soil metagenome]
MTQAGRDLFHALARAIYLLVGLVALLWFGQKIIGVLLFFALALILAIALNAPVTWLERRRIPRTVATILVFAIVGGTLALLGWFTVPRLLRDLTTLINLVPQFVMSLGERISGFVARYPEVEPYLQLDEAVASRLMTWSFGVLQDVWRYSLSLLIALVLTLVLISIVLFAVTNPRPLLAGYIEAMPPHLRDPATRAFNRSSRMVVGWVYSSVIISGMKAVPAFFVLSYLGVPGALVWSAFTFFADLVPRLGFYIMSIPPVLVALAIDPRIALWVALYYWGISEILGNFVAPRIQAATMTLHPVYLLFVTLALVSAFGLIGAIVATPVAGFIRAFYDEFYLARLPKDAQREERVEAMLRREAWGATGDGTPSAGASPEDSAPAKPIQGSSANITSGSGAE